LHLSPDGRTIAFVAVSDGRPQIWVRPLDSSNAQPLPASQGLSVVAGIFWSAGSQYIWVSAQRKVNKGAATGGASQVVCNLPAGYTGGAWNGEGVILLGAAPTGGPLLQVSASGGEPAPVTELDASRKEMRHAFPNFLPDGRHFLYVAESVSDWVAYVGALNSRERHPLPGIASEVKYSSSGRVVVLSDAWLMAQPFDADRLERSCKPFA